MAYWKQGSVVTSSHHREPEHVKAEAESITFCLSRVAQIQTQVRSPIPLALSTIFKQLSNVVSCLYLFLTNVPDILHAISACMSFSSTYEIIWIHAPFVSTASSLL